MWTRCEMQDGGNLLDWNSAEWLSTGLEEVQLERKEVCGQISKQKHLLVFQKHKNFENTAKFCRKNIGGQMAVASNKKTMNALTEKTKPVIEKCKRGFYTGHTDQAEEGVWVDVNTGEKVTLAHWAQSWMSVGSEEENCAVFIDNVGVHSLAPCTVECCPLCEVEELTAYQLQGVCSSSYVDRFYVLQSAVLLLGYIQTKAPSFTAITHGQCSVLQKTATAKETYVPFTLA